MGKHILNLDRGFMKQTRNIILIREPKGLLLSFWRALGAADVYDTCLPDQVELMDYLVDLGVPPIVVNNESLLTDPEGVLRALCHEVGLEFDQNMLQWEAGGRPEDGIWSYHWYKNSHLATQFSKN